MPTFEEVWNNGGSAFSWRVGPGHQGNVAYGMVEGNQYEWVNGTLKVEESSAYLGGYLGFTVANGYEMTIQLSFNKKATWTIDNIEEADAFWDANEDNIRDDSQVDYSYSWNGLTYNHVLKLSMEAGDEVQMDIDNDYGAGIRDFKIKLGSKEYFLEGLVSEYDAIHTDVWVSLIDISPNPIPAGSPGGPPAQTEPEEGSEDTTEPAPADANSLGDTFLEPLAQTTVNGFSYQLWAYNLGYYVLEWKPEASNDDFEQYDFKRSPWKSIIPWISTTSARASAFAKYDELVAMAELWYDVEVIIVDTTFQNGSVDVPGAVGASEGEALDQATFYGGVFRIYGFRLYNQSYILRCAWRPFGPMESPGFMDSEWEWWFGTTYPDLASYEAGYDQLLDYIGNPIYPTPAPAPGPGPTPDPGPVWTDDPSAVCEPLDGESFSSANTTNHSITLQIYSCSYDQRNQSFVGSYLQVVSSQAGSPVIWSGQLLINPADPWSSADNQLEMARAQALAYLDKYNQDFPPESFTWIFKEKLAEAPGVALFEYYQRYEETYDRWLQEFDYRVFRWSLTGWDLVLATADRPTAQAQYDALLAGENPPVENAYLYAILGITVIAGIILVARRFSK
jgi:hypothetical protein